MENVFWARPAPFEDSLVIAPDDGQRRLIPFREYLDELQIQRIDVLELVDKDMVVAGRAVELRFPLPFRAAGLQVQIRPVLLVLKRKRGLLKQAVCGFAPKHEESVVELPDTDRCSLRVLTRARRFKDVDVHEQIELLSDPPGQSLLFQSSEVILNTITIGVAIVVEAHGLQVVHDVHECPGGTVLVAIDGFLDTRLALPYRAQLAKHGKVVVGLADEQIRATQLIANTLPAVGVQGCDPGVVADGCELGIAVAAFLELGRRRLREGDDQKAGVALGALEELAATV